MRMKLARREKQQKQGSKELSILNLLEKECADIHNLLYYA